MDFIDVISQFLTTKSSLEWAGHDLYSFPSAESAAIAQGVTQTTSNVGRDMLQPWTNLGMSKSSLLLPTATGVLLTSLGVVMVKRWHSDSDSGSDEVDVRSCAKHFEASIRGSFKNQSDRTISTLEGLIQRIPKDEPELLVFFTSEESNVTALKLAIKLLRLVFLAKGEDKKLDEIEQDHVATGGEYKSHTNSWRFLKELQPILAQKTGIVISDFQDVHHFSAGLLAFKARDLLGPSKGTYLFLIINTGKTLDNIPLEASPEDEAMNWWVTKKLAPYYRQHVLEEIQNELRERSCVIWKEPLSAIIGP